MARKKKNSLISDLANYNDWSEFCRLSHGNASLYDRIVYLYGLRLDNVDNYDLDSDSDMIEKSVLENHDRAIECNITDYEREYLTEAINLYPQLSISQLYQLKQAMSNLKVLREKLQGECKKNVDSEESYAVQWASDAEEDNLNQLQVDYAKRIIEIDREIRKKKFQRFWKTIRPILAVVVVLLIVAASYAAVAITMGIKFNNLLAEYETRLNELREKTGQNDWIKNYDSDKWLKQSYASRDLSTDLSKLSVPLMVRYNFRLKLYNRLKGEPVIIWNACENQKECIKERIDWYTTFSKAIHDCNNSIKDAKKNSSVSEIENAVCWKRLVTTDNPSPTTLIKSESDENNRLLNERDAFIKKRLADINDAFIKSLRLLQQKFDGTGEWSQKQDLYKQIVALPDQRGEKNLFPENLAEFKNVIIRVTTELFDLRLNEIKDDATSIYENISEGKLKEQDGLVKLDSLIAKIDNVKPYKEMPDKVVAKHKEQAKQYIKSIKEMGSDVKYLVEFQNIRSELSNTPVPDYKGVSQDDYDAYIRQLVEYKKVIEDQGEQIDKWQKRLSAVELSSEEAQKNKDDLEKTLNLAVKERIDAKNKIDAMIGSSYNANLELEKLKSEFDKLDIESLGHAKYIVGVNKIIEDCKEWEDRWNKVISSVSDTSKQQDLRSALSSGRLFMQDLEKIFKDRLGYAINQIAKEASANADVKTYTNQEKLNELETSVENGIASLAELKKNPLPFKQYFSSKIDPILDKLKDRQLEIKDQRLFNSVVDELGLKTKSREGLNDFLTRLETAKNHLDSNYSDSSWKKKNWDETHLRYEVDQMIEQIDQYEAYTNELIQLKTYFGFFKGGLYNPPQAPSFKQISDQIGNIIKNTRNGDYDLIQGDIIDFSKHNYDKDRERFDNPTPNPLYRLIGFLDRNPGANGCIVQYYSLPQDFPVGSYDVVVYDPRGIKIGTITKEGPGRKPQQKIIPGSQIYVGRLVYIRFPD